MTGLLDRRGKSRTTRRRRPGHHPHASWFAMKFSRPGGAIHPRRVSLSGADIRTPHVCRDVSVSAPRPSPSPATEVPDWLCPRRPRISQRKPCDFRHVILNAVGVCDAIPQRNCGRFSRPFLFPKSEKERQACAPHGRHRPPASSIAIITHQRIAMYRYVALLSLCPESYGFAACPRPSSTHPRTPPPAPPRVERSLPSASPSSMARWDR